MISFNLTGLTREILLLQQKAKTRNIFPSKAFQNFTQLSFIVSTFNKNSRFTSNLFSSITALKYFKKKARAEMTTTFLMEEDEEPVGTEPIYLSSDESEYSTPNTTPDHQLECIHPDSINQLISSQLEQRSNMGTATVFYSPTPNMSMISDDEYQMNPTPIIGNPEQYTPQILPRRNHPIQLCQHVQPIPDTPESPTPENCGHSDNICPDDIPHHPSSIPLNNPANIITVADALRNLTLHPHPQSNEWVTGCLVCVKSYDQVIEETVADYLNQTARPGETVRERQIKRNAFIDGIQSGVFTFFPRECRRLPPVTEWYTRLITVDKTQTDRDMPCPYLKIKTNKTLVK